jgi:hypothetical protein
MPLNEPLSRHETIIECLEFEGIDERSYGELCSAYPVLSEAFRKEYVTKEQIEATLQQEKERVCPVLTAHLSVRIDW